MAKSVEDYIIDFSESEESGGGRYKPGTYKVKIVATKVTTSSEKGTPGLKLIMQFLEGRYKGKKTEETLWYSKKAYSRFRDLLNALEQEVPGKISLKSVAKAVKGGVLYVELEMEKERPDSDYRPRARVAFDGFINEDDYDPDASKDDDEDDEDEDIDDEEEEEEDEEDEEEEEEPQPKKRRKAAPKKAKRKPVEEDEDEEEEEEDEDEEEEEPPKKRRRSAKKPASKSRKKKPVDDDDDDDDDVEDLDLTEFE